MPHGDADAVAPAETAHSHRRSIRSFSLRGARLGDKYEPVMAEHGSAYLISFPHGEGISTISPAAHVDFAQEFGREAPLIVEVGPGSGEQLVASALAHPEYNYVGMEAWPAGVARCIKNAVAAGVSNVRLMQLDAAQGLPVLFPADAAAGSAAHGRFRAAEAAGSAAHGMPHAAEVWTFFPDPWRKRKHRKRRLISPEFAHTVAGVLAGGGRWRLATDWANYAWQMRDVLMESPWFDLVPAACPQQSFAHSSAAPAAAPEMAEGSGQAGWCNCLDVLAHEPAALSDYRPSSSDNRLSGSGAELSYDLGLYRGGFAPRWEERVTTRFEERGIEAGRAVYDILALRNDVPLDAYPIPPDPWIAAAARGERVLADQPGVTPPPSSRSGWLREQQREQ